MGTGRFLAGLFPFVLFYGKIKEMFYGCFAVVYANR